MKRQAREIYGWTPDALRRERQARAARYARNVALLFAAATLAALGASVWP